MILQIIEGFSDYRIKYIILVETINRLSNNTPVAEVQCIDFFYPKIFIKEAENSLAALGCYPTLFSYNNIRYFQEKRYPKIDR